MQLITTTKFNFIQMGVGAPPPHLTSQNVHALPPSPNTTLSPLVPPGSRTFTSQKKLGKKCRKIARKQSAIKL